MRTSEAAALAAVNPQTLRYYERRGLLAEPTRLPGGYRAYPVDAVHRVRFIKRAQELGFTLGEVATEAAASRASRLTVREALAYL